MKKAVAFRAWAQVNDFLPMSRRDIVAFEGCTAAWGKALARAAPDPRRPRPGRDPRLLHHRRAAGIRGHGPDARRARAAAPSSRAGPQKDGRLPVNPSGGLKAKGHPIGATGVSMHVLTAMQVRGEAGGMQVEGARLGGVYNMGGACVASYVSILEPLR